MREDQEGIASLTPGPDGLTPTDAAAPLREPVRAQLTDAEQRDLFQSLLFPPPSLDTILRVMNSQANGKPVWYDQLARSTRLAAPDVLASILSVRYAAGDTQAEIARALLPAVDGVRVSARRIARTEGLRVAHAMQMEAHAQLGPLLSGFQIHATLDQFTRPAHAARNGRVWHEGDPEDMQTTLKMDEPSLPDSWNCRCF